MRGSEEASPAPAMAGMSSQFKITANWSQYCLTTSLGNVPVKKKKSRQMLIRKW
jgi:hypothetical protein